jgi:hypothetical protein
VFAESRDLIAGNIFCIHPDHENFIHLAKIAMRIRKSEKLYLFIIDFTSIAAIRKSIENKNQKANCTLQEFDRAFKTVKQRK